jgi:hypothetical protein
MKCPAQPLFAPADAPRGKRRSHGVTDGFLDRGKRGVFPVRTTVSIISVKIQFFFYCLEIVGREQGIGIQNHEIIPAGPLKAVVAGKPLTTVLLEIVPDVELPGKSEYHVFAPEAGAILNDQYLKMPVGLGSQGLQQFFDLIRTVVYGDDDGIFSQGPGRVYRLRI